MRTSSEFECQYGHAQIQIALSILVYRHALLTSTKKSFSAKELQRQLGHKRYHPIWHMAHKLREAMGKRDGEYILASRIELDEGYFSTEIP